MVKLSLLKKIPNISQLSPQTLQLVGDHGFIQSRPQGYDIVVEESPAAFCYFLISGHVRALRMNLEGRIQVLARFGAGYPINMISLLSEEKINLSTIESITEVKLLVLDAMIFARLLEQRTDFSIMLLHKLTERMKKMTNLATDLSLHSVRSRLAKFLIKSADHPQTTAGWTQDEIAAEIGTVRDVVGRLIREFEASGFIKREHQQMSLLNKEKLSQIANSQ